MEKQFGSTRTKHFPREWGSDWWRKRCHATETIKVLHENIHENDNAQERGARFTEVRRGGARQVRESPVQWGDWVTSWLTLECLGKEVSYLLCYQLLSYSRIEWTMGNWLLSLIWVFRVPEVCFWLLSIFFFFLTSHLSSSHQEAQSSSGNCAVTARGSQGGFLFALYPHQDSPLLWSVLSEFALPC